MENFNHFDSSPWVRVFVFFNSKERAKLNNEFRIKRIVGIGWEFNQFLMLS